MHRQDLLDGLKGLSESRFQELIFVLAVDRSLLPSRYATQTEQAIALLQLINDHPTTLESLEKRLGSIGGRSGLQRSLSTSKKPMPEPTPNVSSSVEEGLLSWATCQSVDGWCWVRGGHFTMGSNRRRESAYPPVQVELPGFYMAEHPVSSAQFLGFLLDSKYRWPRKFRRILEEKPNHPATHVSHEDALAYCRWAGVSLPSEAQWEYAARGPQNHLYPWGEGKPTQELGHFAAPSISAVGKHSKGASWCGCQDMAGNVWEWTSDIWTPGHHNATGTQEPVKNGIDLSIFVMRGGSWISVQSHLTGSYRHCNRQENREETSGFRVVKEVAYPR